MRARYGLYAWYVLWGLSASAVDFESEVWTKVASRSCLKCHKAGGDAEDTRFVLLDPAVSKATDWLQQNQATLSRIAKLRKNSQPLMLLKVTDEEDHEGGEVLAKTSSGFRILERFVREGATNLADRNDDSFFAGVTMIDDRRLLRRVTLSLAGRLPTDSEHRQGLIPTMDALMQEDAFYERLLEGFNDIFLMQGVDGAAERILGYRNFGNTRLWYQKVKFEEIADKKERQQAKYALARRYRKSVLHEPYALIEHIVRNDRPFTEIITADYLMVSPYTAKGYGIFEELKDQFKDPEDHMEFIPAKLKQLSLRTGKPDQITPTGYYPHSGLLTTFHYLQRYPTTDTNRNRQRARKYFEHFLGVDVMELAPRVTDAAAVDAKYDVPTMEAADCVVCHKSIDPIAGLFQDYQNPNNDFGPYGPRKEGWFKDMFGPGTRPDELPETDLWRALQWLGQRTAKDPRFAVAMVEHVYYILTGRKPLQPPKDIDDPLFPNRQRAYRAQRKEIERIAKEFAAANFNLKAAFKSWVQSRFYRADGLALQELGPERTIELADLGLVRLLSPEQLHRKIRAIFGLEWTLVTGQDYYRILYGGIDSKAVTERILEPSGAMGAIQRIMANEVACKTVPADFAKEPGQRRLFPNIEPAALPAEEAKVRDAIVHLHSLILGREDQATDPEVERTFQLFAGIIEDANRQGRFDPRENYFCRAGKEEIRSPDPNYTMRAWRAVVTYLLRQPEFLYE